MRHIAGEVVIPIQSNSDPEILKIKHGSFKYYAYGYELAFSMTYHKIQGQTVNKIILDINKNSTRKLDLPSLYVDISRVRNHKDMCILPLKSHDHLLKLSNDPDLVKWWTCFFNNGLPQL